MTYYPSQDTKEPHYLIDEAANRLRMPVGALVERIKAGEIETKYNGRRSYVAAGEITRFSAELRREAEAAQVTEDERAGQERQERDGAHIARLMGEAQEIARSSNVGGGGDGRRALILASPA